jgi:hypothetical protein
MGKARAAGGAARSWAAGRTVSSSLLAPLSLTAGAQKRGAPNASKSLTLEQLSGYFHQPINEVAVEVRTTKKGEL